MNMDINKYWKVKPDNNGCGVISLRDDISLWSKFCIRWPKKITVLEFHRAVQAWLNDPDGGLSFDNATDRGNFKISPSLEHKVDRVFQLQKSWEVHPDSLKALKLGPLLNAEGTKILVPARGTFASFVNWLDESPVRKVIGFFLPFAIIAANLFGVF